MSDQTTSVKVQTSDARPAVRVNPIALDHLTGLRKITKRFVICLIGCAMIWWFLHVHRQWVWEYFVTLLSYKTIPPELAQVAQASISSITTVAITGITAVSAIALFLVTGNAAVLRSFNFASIGQASASVASQAVSEYRAEKSEHTEHVINEDAPNANLREHLE